MALPPEGPMIAALALIACSTDVTLVPGTTTAPAPDPGPLVLTVDAPVAGTFVGDRVAVAGRVSDPQAIVWIEGYRANVGADGGFSVEVPVDDDFRIVDVEAGRPWTEEHLRERIVVFGGADPMATWPGGVGLRVTPVALDHVAELLEAQLLAADVPGQLEAVLPEIAFADTVISPTGVVAWPPQVTVTSGTTGLAFDAVFGRFEIGYQFTAPWIGTIDLVLGIDGSGIGGDATLGIDADGNLALAVSDTSVTLGAPVIEIAGIDPEILEQLAANLTAGLAGVLEGLLDTAIGGIGSFTVPLGDLSLDGLGVPLTLGIASLGTDEAGIAALLEIDVGVPPAVAPIVPDLIASGPQADVAVTVHEGLVQGLLDGLGLLELLDLDLELPGFLGEIVALPLTGLPGGEQLPDDKAGMCFTIAANDGHVARLKPGLTPLAVVTLPDVLVDVGVLETAGGCTPWLTASLAVQASFDAQGTALSTRLDVVDGSVMWYAAEGEFSEDELVAGLGGLVDAASVLLDGAGLEIDLADLLGGLDGGALPLGDLAPRLLDATPARGEDGVVQPGTMVLAVSLWD